MLEDKSLPATRWPKGGASPPVFRPDWSPGNANAPYLACDRTGLARTHQPAWADGHPDRAWHPGRTIAFYLSEVHRGLRGTVLLPPRCRPVNATRHGLAMDKSLFTQLVGELARRGRGEREAGAFLLARAGHPGTAAVVRGSSRSPTTTTWTRAA